MTYTTGIQNQILVSKNADFSGDTVPEIQNGLITDGQLWIGSTALNDGDTHINVGVINSSTLDVQFNTPNISIETKGGAQPIERVGLDLGPNNPVMADASGQIDFTGGFHSFADFGTPVVTRGPGPTTYELSVQIADAYVASNVQNAGLCSFDSTDFDVDANGFVSLSGAIPGTDLHVARFIVHPTAASANYTTITAAIAAASAGDTIAIQSKATAYNEDFTLPTGINLVAYSADAYTPNVVIKGKITCTSAGSRSISGIQLETDGDNIIEITGANAVELNLINCYLDMADATGIDINNANATVNCFHCKGNLQTTGISIFNIAACTMMNFEYCYFDNTGDSTTANAIASGNIRQWWTRFANPVSVTGDAEITQRWARIECSPLDVTCLTLNTSNDGSNSFHSVYSSSDADGIVLTAGELRLSFADISTDIAFDAISGAGSLEYSAVSFRESNAVTVSSQKTYSFRQGKPPFEEITGTSHTAIPGGHYIANNGSLVTITLPSVFEVGDIVWIVGKGAGLWALDCPAGDVIHFGNQDTSSGGTITATNRYDAIQVVGTVANSEWTCTGVSQGNLTVA